MIRIGDPGSEIWLAAGNSDQSLPTIRLDFLASGFDSTDAPLEPAPSRWTSPHCDTRARHLDLPTGPGFTLW
jgi:hypothetical protein